MAAPLQLFTVDNNTIKVNRIEVLTYEEFKIILHRVHADSALNMKELLYVKYMADQFDRTNLYAVLSEQDRHDAIVRDIGMPRDWEPDEFIEIAIDAYRRIQDNLSPTTALLQELKIGLTNTRKMVKQINAAMHQLMQESEEKGISEMLVDLEKLDKLQQRLVKITKDLPTALDSIEQLTKQALMEYGVEKLRGGREKGNREDPERLIK